MSLTCPYKIFRISPVLLGGIPLVHSKSAELTFPKCSWKVTLFFVSHLGIHYCFWWSRSELPMWTTDKQLKVWWPNMKANVMSYHIHQSQLLRDSSVLKSCKVLYQCKSTQLTTHTKTWVTPKGFSVRNNKFILTSVLWALIHSPVVPLLPTKTSACISGRPQTEFSQDSEWSLVNNHTNTISFYVLPH